MSVKSISLLHHWLVGLRGGEKVLEQFCTLFPNAHIHTLVKTEDLKKLGDIIPVHDIRCTFLDLLPFSETIYQNLLPLFPVAIGNHNVKSDFVLSSDASLIKGMKLDRNTPHVCYCHSPPRYLWDMQEEYLANMNPLKAKVFLLLTPYLRKFDLKGAENVDHFIANSRYVKERIQRIYNRESTVIHPPVALEDFDFTKESEDFYLMVSALVPYKRVDLAVKAFNKLGKKLVIIGEGSEYDKLKTLADDNIEMLGSQSFDVLKDHYARCKAFIFPGVEDFGITPLEAQASGKPVIAMKKGGALETVLDNETGIFFEKQTPEALIEAVEKFEKIITSFDSRRIRRHAEKFSPDRFRSEIKAFLIEKYPSYFSNFEWGC